MKALAALIAIALLALGCRKSVAPACRQLCACSPCTGADLDACVVKAEAAQDSAEQKSCGDEFEAFLGCFEDTVTCGDSKGEIATTHRCTRVEERLKVCADAGNPFATVCEEALAKIAACTNSEVPKTSPPCVGIQACQLTCSLAADCDALLGFKFDQDFADCNNACVGGVSPPKP